MNAVLCERVRAFISLELDDDVSELERSVLEAHTEDCRACREFRAGVTGFTGALRVAPHESVGRSFRLPSRPRRVARIAPTAAAAAAVIIVAGLAGIIAPVGGNGGSSFATPTQPLLQVADDGPLTARALSISVPRQALTCKSFTACPR